VLRWGNVFQLRPQRATGLAAIAPAAGTAMAPGAIITEDIEMKTHLLAATPAIAADFPFVGKWNCEISEFTFTNRTANNGSETFRFLKSKRRRRACSEVKKELRLIGLVFKKATHFSLLNIKAKTMTWHSLASGDTFNCKREAD
jgi:hypothetical protein